MTSNVGSDLISGYLASNPLISKTPRPSDTPLVREAGVQDAVSETGGVQDTNTPLTRGDEGGLEKIIMNELKAYFRPEFLNRIDDIVVYNPLSESVLEGIIDILLQDVTRLLAEKHITVSYDESLKKELIATGYDREFGARPLKRAITRMVINPLSTKILAGELTEGAHIMLSIQDGVFTMTRPFSIDK